MRIKKYSAAFELVFSYGGYVKAIKYLEVCKKCTTVGDGNNKDLHKLNIIALEDALKLVQEFLSPNFNSKNISQNHTVES